MGACVDSMCTDLVYWQLSRNCGLDVSSSLSSQVHHHRPIFHALYHWFGDQDRCPPTCNVGWRHRHQGITGELTTNWISCLSYLLYIKVQIKSLMSYVEMWWKKQIHTDFQATLWPTSNSYWQQLSLLWIRGHVQNCWNPQSNGTNVKPL